MFHRTRLTSSRSGFPSSGGRSGKYSRGRSEFVGAHRDSTFVSIRMLCHPHDGRLPLEACQISPSGK